MAWHVADRRIKDDEEGNRSKEKEKGKKEPSRHVVPSPLSTLVVEKGTHFVRPSPCRIKTWPGKGALPGVLPVLALMPRLCSKLPIPTTLRPDHLAKWHRSKTSKSEDERRENSLLSKSCQTRRYPRPGEPHIQRDIFSSIPRDQLNRLVRKRASN